MLRRTIVMTRMMLTVMLMMTQPVWQPGGRQLMLMWCPLTRRQSHSFIRQLILTSTVQFFSSSSKSRIVRMNFSNKVSAKSNIVKLHKMHFLQLKRLLAIYQRCEIFRKSLLFYPSKYRTVALVHIWSWVRIRGWLLLDKGCTFGQSCDSQPKLFTLAQTEVWF